MDDVALLEAWRTGDGKAGEELFARYFDRLFGFFTGKCHGEADELVQRTFLACVRSKDQFRGDASFATYVFTIARHELYRHLRERRRGEANLDLSVTSIADLVTTPGTRLGRNQEKVRLVETLRTLPVEQQTLLELHYWQDLDAAALGTVFGITAAAARVRLHRARAVLRERLGDPDSGPSDDEASTEQIMRSTR